jgi:hypothetical protein
MLATPSPSRAVIATPAEEGTVLTAAGATVEAGMRQDASGDRCQRCDRPQGCTSPTFFGTKAAHPPWGSRMAGRWRGPIRG